MRIALIVIVSALAAIIGIPLATVGPAKLVEIGARPAAEPSAKPLLGMTQAERRSAYLERKAAEAPQVSVQDRARWACSTAIEDRARVPGSVEWVRRSTWGAIEVQPGRWLVEAHYTAENAMGVKLRGVSECRLRRHEDGTFSVLEVGRSNTARQRSA